MTDVKFSSYSMYTRKKYDYDFHDWCVFVDEPQAILDQIESVEYTLDPSFPEPVRTISDRNHCFALHSSGFGGFTIKIEVLFTNGLRINTTFRLVLKGDEWPRKSLDRGAATNPTVQVYDQLFHPKYRWRTLETIITGAGLPKSEVQTILLDLEHDNLARRSPFPSIDNKELWGAAEVVGIAPEPQVR